MPSSERSKKRKSLMLKQAASKSRRLTDLFVRQDIADPPAVNGSSETIVSHENVCLQDKKSTPMDCPSPEIVKSPHKDSVPIDCPSPEIVKSPQKDSVPPDCPSPERVKTPQKDPAPPDCPSPERETVQLRNIEDEPHQPMAYNFPKRPFVRQKLNRAFQSSWFKQWTLLHYPEYEDVAYCHVCIKAKMKFMISEAKCDTAFTKEGYGNWEKATSKDTGFRRHEMSAGHREAVYRLLNLPATSSDIGDVLFSSHAKQKEQNSKMLLKVLSTVRFLARQGLGLRGDENTNNLLQLLRLRCEDDEQLHEWLKRKRENFTSHEVQNEMLQLMSMQISREISSDIHSSTFYAIMADEATDVSNHEQLVICLRWIDQNLIAQEEFIGLYEINRCDAETLTNTIKDVLLRLNLSLNQCRGQCYDGASAMTGKKSGVSTRLKSEERRCLLIHFYGHSLNLACSDSVKQCTVMRDLFDTTFELTKLVKYSPKREAKLQSINDAISMEEDSTSPKIRMFCPTRWTVRATTLDSVLKNYSALEDLWEWALKNCTETEMRARLLGVQSQMQKFEYFFGLHLGHTLFLNCDNLSKALQASGLSAAEGQELAQMTETTLRRIRNDDSFELFWQKAI